MRLRACVGWSVLVVAVACSVDPREFKYIGDGTAGRTGEATAGRLGEPPGESGAGGEAGRAEDCSGCLIGSRCVPKGQHNPDNGCEICDPTKDDAGWSPDDGRSCDDGSFCTIDDTCEDGKCVGTARECDDGIACNGTSECDESADRCTQGKSTCTDSICDLEQDQCVPTCAGCIISEQCVPEGWESPENPCLICDPSVSIDSYSPKERGSACGDDTDVPCNAPDTCDGNGECLSNITPNATSCDDGLYCTTASACQDGDCIAITQRSCSTNQRCDEPTQSCVCAGCTIGSSCVASGAKNPNNPCQVCSPSVAADAYSPFEGTCPGGECNAGACELYQNPFDCIVPDPPTVVLPDERIGRSDAPPAAQGGTIIDGKYTPTRIDLFTTVATIDIRTFEFSKGFVQVGQRPFGLSTGAAWIPQIEFAGSYTTSGNQIRFTLDRCDPSYDIDVPNLAYTVSANGMVTIETLSDGSHVMVSYLRQ